MGWLLRGIVIFVVALALFWLLAIVVGWLGYLLMGVGAVAFIVFLIWLFNTRDTPLPAAKQGRKHERRASKELSALEKRLKNPPQR